MALLEKDIWEMPIIIRHHERLAETKKYIAEENFSGVFAEFGVNTGSSINYFASLYSKKIFHGFDSFEGLTENWRNLPKGCFFQEKIPSVNKNVRLWIGYFKETLPSFVEFLKQNNEKMKFIHIDCDLEYSTNEIFTHLNDFIQPGTFILFDEIFNGHDEEYNQELKAFNNWLDTYSRKVKMLFRTDRQQMFCEVIV